MKKCKIQKYGCRDKEAGDGLEEGPRQLCSMGDSLGLAGGFTGAHNTIKS